MPETSRRTRPGIRRFAPVAGAALIAFVGLFGYEAGRMGAGADPALAREQSATSPSDASSDAQGDDEQAQDDGGAEQAFGGAPAPESRLS